MEKLTELILLRDRSIAAVLRDGYRLYTSTFRRLFRSSWIVATAYAIAFALLMGNLVNNVVPVLTAVETFGPDAAIAGADVPMLATLGISSLLFFTLMALALAAHGVTAMQEHLHTDDIARPPHWYGRLCLPALGRLAVAFLWVSLAVLAAAGLLAATAWGILQMGVVTSLWRSVATIVLLCLLAFLLFAMLLPLAYTVPRHLLDRKFSWLPPVKGYGQGLSHWGLLFATLLVVSLLTSLLTLVCELPAVIIAVANVEAYSGLAIGDPLGMPSYIGPMTYGVFALAGFIQAYAHLSTLFPFYYAYGTIEQQQRERNTLKQA